MRKTKTYIHGMQDAQRPFVEPLQQTAENIHDLNNRFDEIIDCIIWNHDDPEKLIEMLKSKRASKPKQFRIAVVYSGKENEDLADALRKDLNNLKNTCQKMDYRSFVKQGSNIVDYRVYIGNPEKEQEEKCKVLYKAYGMRILQIHSSYIADYDPKFHFDATNRERFIEYYESIISESLERSKKAEAALKRRKERMAKSGGSIDPTATNAVLDAVIQGSENAIDFWDDKPGWMQFVIGIPSALVSIVGAFLTFVLCVPAMISEILLRNTIDNLREADFDSKFVADAQQQILEVKIVDLFRLEQSKDILCEQEGKTMEENSHAQSGAATPMSENHKNDSANRSRKVGKSPERVGKYYGIRPKDAVKFWWADTKYTLGIKSKKKR